MAQDLQVPGQEPSEGKRGVLQAGLDEEGVTQLIGVGADGGVLVGDQTDGVLTQVGYDSGDVGDVLQTISSSLTEITNLLVAQNAVLTEAFETMEGLNAKN